MAASNPAGAANAATRSSKQPKVSALLCTLGAAPRTWHVIEGVGYVHPTIPSPVGGRGELSIGKARDLARTPGCRVRHVRITDEEAAEARAARDAARNRGISGARETRAAGRRAVRAEVAQVQNEVAAATAGRE